MTNFGLAYGARRAHECPRRVSSPRPPPERTTSTPPITLADRLLFNAAPLPLGTAVIPAGGGRRDFRLPGCLEVGDLDRALEIAGDGREADAVRLRTFRYCLGACHQKGALDLRALRLDSDTQAGGCTVSVTDGVATVTARVGPGRDKEKGGTCASWVESSTVAQHSSSCSEATRNPTTATAAPDGARP
eukprot:scaffold4786_cov104-Isochrysis_galbana.AAC.1